MNSFYQMFNNPYIQQQAMKAQQEHQEQTGNILKSAQKLKDYLDSLDDIKPEYREQATRAFCAIVAEYIINHTTF